MSKSSLNKNKQKNQTKNKLELENVRKQPFFTSNNYKEKKEHDK